MFKIRLFHIFLLYVVCGFDVDAKALVIQEPIKLVIEHMGFKLKTNNQALACVLTGSWKKRNEREEQLEKGVLVLLGLGYYIES